MIINPELAKPTGKENHEYMYFEDENINCISMIDRQNYVIGTDTAIVIWNISSGKVIISLSI